MNEQQLIQYVKEINETDNEINMLLLRKYTAIMELQLTSKQAVLIEHLNKHKRMTVSELANMMNITSSAVSQLVSKLDKEGYVKREINPNNRREIFVELDQTGLDHIAHYEEVELSIIKQYYSKLDMEDIKALRTIGRKLLAIVEADLK
ncbi:MarR family transcriptional regulator [Peribacillus frigoritolerans]|uniref:MarR family winged helix-turn-helix transcriptional regulator n=1 Tax=Peribacillus frigoritolerans TaxID=450367 RepID=UPI002225D8AA|nr:MarR family transcriptional regulator [Peribacillus frigoritolerans]UYY97449.1 MarR family transcriptional regulator [Peribacillus frigoritolerans]